MSDGTGTPWASPQVLAWASPQVVALGTVAFVIWWLFAVFPAVPFLPIGRTAGSILGATLMVVFQVISPNQAFAVVDLPILGLLFGTMVISVYLKRADLFKYVGKALSWKTRGGMDLLCRLCLLSALSSALFTNDTTCVVLTSFVLDLCRRENLDPKPFLIALACSSNIGSATTPIGNPQNLVIAVNSGISFGRFLAGVLPAMAVGLVVNTLLLLAVYGRSLSLPPGDSTGGHQTALRTLGNSDVRSKKTGHGVVPARPIPSQQNGDVSEHDESGQHSIESRGPNHVDGHGTLHTNAGDEIIEEDGDGRGRNEREHVICSLGFQHIVRSGSPRGALSTAVSRDDLEAPSDVAGMPKKRGLSNVCARLGGIVCGRRRVATLGQKRKRLVELWRRYLWKASVYLVTIGMLAALLAGLSLPWTAITAAVVMMMLDFSDAGPNLDQVSYALLVFFSGMFIATSGFKATGAPQEFWKAVEPHSRVDTASGVIVLSLVIVVLSNVVSNVPTVILLGSNVAISAAQTRGASSEKAWLILAWVSTVAGNLTLVGSAANIIVCEQARATPAEKARREELSKNLQAGTTPADVVRREEELKNLQGLERATYDLTFWNHLKFGFPSTLIVIAVGLLPLAI